VNQTVKKGLKLAAIGFPAGALIGVLILLFSHPGAFRGDYSTGKLVFYLLHCGVHGAISVGFSAVYSIEEWSVTRMTAVHFAITMGSLYLMGWIQGWLHFSGGEFIIFTACIVVSYFIVWLIFYLRGKKSVDEMNEDLVKWKRAHPEDAPLKQKK